MFSVKDRFFKVKERAERELPVGNPAKNGLPSLDGLRRQIRTPRLGKRLRRPRISIQVWLTALFLFVTALACVTAYSIVTPFLDNTLQRSAEAPFRQVGERFEARIKNDPEVSEQAIRSFATRWGVGWGIVRVTDDAVIRQRGNLGDHDPAVVRKAIDERYPETGVDTDQSGERAGQVLATYATPIEVKGVEDTAIVFARYYTESDVVIVSTALNKLDRLVLLAGALALLVAGFSGYVVANLISRRLSRLDSAARRLTSGNFDERITTRLEDEVGSLGATFNAMASSLKGAFRQLQQEKMRSQAILDGMTDAVVGVDRDLNPTFLNPRARELLENSEPSFHERLQEVLAKSRFSGGPVTEPEVEAGERIIEVRAAPLEDGALAILRDVTEERQIDRAKAEFIANASHELKTPLFALSGYLEMMEDEEDEETRMDFLKAMRVATERLQNLAKTLLDLSRLDANAVTFRLEDVDLEELLHGLKRDFAYTGREIRFHVEGDIPPVRTDPVQLHRMLAILLDNALKYSGGPEGSQPVDLDLRREDEHVTVSVRDRGCGIPQPEIRHIFERFYRAQGSSRADGTGLGLALAWEIAQHLGGDICVKSEQDVGSTFTVELPIFDEAEQPDRPPQHSNVS